jgi:signal transduction histidine kinase
MKAAGKRVRGISLRARVTSWYVGLLAVTLLVFSLGIYAGMKTYLKRSLQQSLSSTADSIINNFLVHLPEKGEAWAVGEISESYPPTSTDRVIRITGAGRVLYQSGATDRQTSILQFIPPATVDRPEGNFRRYHVKDEAWMMYAVPFKLQSGQTFEIEVGGSMAIVSQTLHSLSDLFFIATPLILIAAAIGGYLMMKRPLRPLLVLTEKAEGIGRKQLGERLPITPTNDELERLTHSLNRMIDRLEEALAHNYRFSADASHELRTPLTIMRGELEEMLQLADLPPQAFDNLVSSLDEIDRMSRIVHSLMAITRLDVGGERMDLQPVNLTALARSTIDHMRLLAVEKDVPLTLDAPKDVWLSADSLRVKQILVNLIDNAIKYTPGNTVAQPVTSSTSSASKGIIVSISTAGSHATLTVSDHGIGVSEQALPHIFERFYRADYARNRVAGGVGLGLAIVKSIVAAHDGTVAMISIEGQGSTVTVELPLLEKSAIPDHAVIDPIPSPALQTTNTTS